MDSNPGLSAAEVILSRCSRVADFVRVKRVNAEARHSTSFPNQDLFQLRTAEASPVALEMATINGPRALMWEEACPSWR